MLKLAKLKKRIGCYLRPAAQLMNSGIERRQARYAFFYKHCRVNSRIVLYESFFGRGMLCNPYAIFLYLIKDKRFRDLTHIWVLDNKSKHADMISEWKSYNNVIFINRHSKEYLKYLCSSKYLINNSTFPPYFTKKPQQVYINTWHGIPLKTIGFDIPNGRIEGFNPTRNFMQTDYMISASPFLTECYLSAFGLHDIYQGRIIEAGYPRLDLLKLKSRKEAIQLLQGHGVKIDPDKEIILYAPTWHGESYDNAIADVGQYYQFKRSLEDIIDTDRYQLLIKVHQRVFELARNQLKDDFFIPVEIEANLVLSAVDILISDYSSIYFDFLPTGRPILFYMEDLDVYKNQRGLYRTPDQLPGPFTDSVETLADWITNIDNIKAKYRVKYHNELVWSGARDVGSITEKVVDIIFRNQDDPHYLKSVQTNKQRLLFIHGRTRPNGITASLLNLLNKIDYNRFDVSLLVSGIEDTAERGLIERVHPAVRVFYNNATANRTVFEQFSHERNMNYGFSSVYHKMYGREWRRLFGSTRFDRVIEFEGFTRELMVLALQDRSTKRIAWQHSDMMAECETRMPFLRPLFGLYKYFDRIVSCGSSIMQENLAKLAPEFIDPDKLTYAGNMIDESHIENRSKENNIINVDGTQYIEASNEQNGGSRILELLPYIPRDSASDVYAFVAVGRLSPEKNYSNLIKGFSKFERRYPGSYLYILGEGPERAKLEALIQGLNLNRNVIMPGFVENPFAIIKNCDCFILPSLYEGQPMVINEARILHMPIIISDFASADDVMIEDGQLQIGTTAESIYKGMLAFAEGKVPCSYVFDTEAYNMKVYNEFKKAIGYYDI